MEADATARYPTLIQDTNGNQILIRYKPGILNVDASGNNNYVGWGNTSGRIDQIEDVRALSTGVWTGTDWVYATYQFNYNNDASVPHLTSITNNISTSEGYQFSYYGSATLTSPWGTASGTATKMSAVTINGVALSYYFVWQPFRLPGDLFFISALPAQPKLGDFLWVSAVSIVATGLAAFIPARRAASIEPAKIIR